MFLAFVLISSLAAVNGRQVPKTQILAKLPPTEEVPHKFTLLPLEQYEFAGPLDFDVDAACARLWDAMDPLGTDEDVIIDVLAAHTNDQRQRIRVRYQEMYATDLIWHIEDETSYNFEDTLVDLLTPYTEYLAQWLFAAMDPAGTDEALLIEILTGKSSKDILEVKEKFAQISGGGSLEYWLDDELSGDFLIIMNALAAADRDENSTVNQADVNKDVDDLVAAGADHPSTNLFTFLDVLCHRSYAHLEQLLITYKAKTGRELSNDIDSEFSGDSRSVLLAIVKKVENAPAFYAGKLYEAMEGAGTEDGKLIRILVCRYEIDVREVRTFFDDVYPNTLYEEIADETSGSYEDALLRLIEGF